MTHTDPSEATPMPMMPSESQMRPERARGGGVIGGVGRLRFWTRLMFAVDLGASEGLGRDGQCSKEHTEGPW